MYIILLYFFLLPSYLLPSSLLPSPHLPFSFLPSSSLSPLTSLHRGIKVSAAVLGSVQWTCWQSGSREGQVDPVQSSTGGIYALSYNTHSEAVSYTTIIVYIFHKNT